MRELQSAERYAAQALADAPDDVRKRATALVEAARTRLSYWDVGGNEIDAALAQSF
ncbi:MAG: hypothetical protein R3E12_09535 [Candidatus Eisenbacteria bacterium]